MHWRGQEADLLIEQGGTELTIGALQNIEVSILTEVEQLRASGSLKRLDAMRHQEEVSISAEVMEFDQDTLEALTDYDSSNTEIQDASDVATFTIGGHFVSNTGDEMDLEIKEVKFEELEIGGSRDEWIGLPLEGEGNDLVIHGANYLEAPDVSESADTDGTVTVSAFTILDNPVEGETIEVTSNPDSLSGISVGDTSDTDSNGDATFSFNESTTGDYTLEFAVEDKNITTSCTVTIT